MTVNDRVSTSLLLGVLLLGLLLASAQIQLPAVAVELPPQAGPSPGGVNLRPIGQPGECSFSKDCHSFERCKRIAAS